MKPMTEKDEKRELEFVMMCLAIVCGCGVLTEMLRTILSVVDWMEGTMDAWMLVTRGVNLAVALVCGVTVIVIMQEVKRRRVFTHKNANLVTVIGCVAVFGGIAQNVINNLVYENITKAYSDIMFMIIGVFILFIACLFKIGIRMKEEQDLTV